MTILKKETERMDLHIEEYKNTILVQQKWKYKWLNKTGTTAWSYSQKQNFHKETDTLIWKKWGSHYKLRTKGKSKFAKKYINKSLTLNFDIKWVTSNEHWNVNVTKIKDGDYERSNVKWNAREINLDTEDIDNTYRGKNGKDKVYQYPVVHEFGHAIGNSTYAGISHGDEYKKTSSFIKDKLSVMNIGYKLRKRHIDYVLKQLNTIIPDTKFYIYDL